MIRAALTASFLPATLILAETVTLQQGVDNYGGCTTRTIADTRPVPDAGTTTLPLRGSRNFFHIRFELPNRNGPVARARLMVFLPAARNPNRFMEIFCHEAVSGGRQISWDEITDYDNGRPRGAVDSVELFAPAHEGWPHFPFLPLGVPTGGKWIEFNLTALVEKWLAGRTSNHGVVLIPSDPPDRRSPSTWEIDIPSPGHTEAALRPRLVIEYAGGELAADHLLVAMTGSLQRISDRSTRYGFRGEYRTSYRMSMAANEYEGFQVVLYPMLADLQAVQLGFSDLVEAKGSRIPASNIQYFLEDSYQMRRNWMTRELMFAGKLYETVDPLPPGRAICIRRHVHTPFLVNIRTRPDTPAGIYRGRIAVTSEGRVLRDLDLEVKVWPYAIPEKWNFHTMGQFIWSNVERFHGGEADEALFRRYYDFLLDHRFTPTEQYRRPLSPRMNLQELLRRGINTVYLNGNFSGSDTEVEQLKRDAERVTKLGALDHALVYIGDETNKWGEMQRRADLIHAHAPGAMVMIGGSIPRDELLGYIDIYDPQISGGSKVYSLEQDAIRLIAESQRRGEEFYWYVAAGPAYPYPNVQVENPLIASRVLFWMTWKYGVTGFEYYCYNLFERNQEADPAKRYPNVKWQADGWSRGWPSNGDGLLFYPGPISSLRFEAIRDGIEDWESHMVLRDCVEAVRNRKSGLRYSAMIQKAEEQLKVADEVVTDFRTYTQDPERLLAEREKLGNLIAEFIPIVARLEEWDAGQLTLAKSAEVRIARHTALRRRMLRQRHIEACRRLDMDPVTEDAWTRLWPERILFSQDFEKEGRWTGSVTTANVPPGSRRALAGISTNKYFGRWAAVDIHFDNARAAARTWLRFKYFVTRPVPIQIMAFNMTKGDNFVGVLAKPLAGVWREAALRVGEFRKKTGSGRMEAGDAIDDLFFGAGKPGEKLELLIDDVQLVGLDQ
jgi:hypothetical protein